MNLEDLKQGDVFYEVTLHGIKRYEYLMLYPFHNPENVKVKGYHIVLDKSLDEPKRVYYQWLEKVLSDGIHTYEDAKKLQIKKVEEYLETLKKLD
jgi:hypothetical protein